MVIVKNDRHIRVIEVGGSAKDGRRQRRGGRAQIIDAAIVSILEVGFYRASTNEIARRARRRVGAHCSTTSVPAKRCCSRSSTRSIAGSSRTSTGEIVGRGHSRGTHHLAVRDVRSSLRQPDVARATADRVQPAARSRHLCRCHGRGRCETAAKGEARFGACCEKRSGPTGAGRRRSAVQRARVGSPSAASCPPRYRSRAGPGRTRESACSSAACAGAEETYGDEQSPRARPRSLPGPGRVRSRGCARRSARRLAPSGQHDTGCGKSVDHMMRSIPRSCRGFEAARIVDEREVDVPVEVRARRSSSAGEIVRAGRHRVEEVQAARDPAEARFDEHDLQPRKALQHAQGGSRTRWSRPGPEHDRDVKTAFCGVGSRRNNSQGECDEPEVLAHRQVRASEISAHNGSYRSSWYSGRPTSAGNVGMCDRPGALPAASPRCLAVPRSRCR